MTQKFSYEQWKKISSDLNRTKQSVQQMSKLYVIAHEKVKIIIRQCQTNLTYDPRPDCQRQLQFLKTILQRLAERPNDQYLSKIDPASLDKYQKSFFDLIELLRLALMTYDNKQKLNIEQLKGVRQDKITKKGQFSLRRQIQKSKNRMIRTKSGHRITRDSKRSDKKADNQQYQQLFSEANQIQLIEPEQHEKQFVDKKAKLQQTINNFIGRQGYSLNFRKKYQKLQQYLQQRKEFADLIFCQKYYDQMIENGKTRKNQPKTFQKKDPDLNKIFPQFNIKTKYLKNHVKQNILQVIFDVKKQLLKQYHQSNVTKMRQANEGGMIKLNHQKKVQKKNRSQSSDMASTQNMQNRFRSTNRLIQKRRNSTTNLKGFDFRKTSSPWHKDDQINKLQKRAHQMFAISKMPHYKKEPY